MRLCLGFILVLIFSGAGFSQVGKYQSQTANLGGVKIHYLKAGTGKKPLVLIHGFGFPFDHFSAPHWVGVISLFVLAVAILARYAFHLAGAWRWIYAVGAVVALYLNVFVGVVQAFQKVPALKALAPTQAEPPFLLTQLVVMGLFVALAIVAAIRFRIETVGTSARAA